MSKHGVASASGMICSVWGEKIYMYVSINLHRPTFRIMCTVRR